MPGLEKQALPRSVPLKRSTPVLDDIIPRPEGQGLATRRGEEIIACESAIRADGLHWPQRLSRLPVGVVRARQSSARAPHLPAAHRRIVVHELVAEPLAGDLARREALNRLVQRARQAWGKLVG